jgi:nucleotidyltransferase/DNA polymerase involved in DNA repair
MDAFYAAIEEREDRSLRGQPVVVGADPQQGKGRGVVATANYAARRYGIGSAMPISEAWRRCPGAVYVKPRMRLYAQVSEHVFDIFEEYTDLIEPISIDEAFLDVTASRRLHGDGAAVARAIKDEIRRREGLTASIGCSTSKFVSKVASDLDKPDGLVVVETGRERDFLATLEVERLWGAGPRALERFQHLGCSTIGDVADTGREVLVRNFGEAMGDRFHRLSRGLDARPVETGHIRKSLGKEITFDRDVEDREEVERTLLDLCERVASGLRKRGLAGSTVTLKLRWEGFETVTRQRTLEEPINTFEKLCPVARALLRGADQPARRVRLVGVSISHLEAAVPGQLGLFSEGTEKVDTRIAEAMDRLAERFGQGTVTRAALLDRKKKRTD